MTECGKLVTGTREELFARALTLAADAGGGGQRFDVALGGGSTPREWFRWCVGKNALPAPLVQDARFTVSDERCVPLHSEQSNFGQAERYLLTPLRIPESRWQPWPVHLLPSDAAEAYAIARTEGRGSAAAYDVCFLGMGDDGHIASIFPGSPLLGEISGRFFAAVDAPGKGWRLTITPAGLAACRLIILMVLGEAKRPMLKKVFHGTADPREIPARLTRAWRERVVWLTDQSLA